MSLCTAWIPSYIYFSNLKSGQSRIFLAKKEGNGYKLLLPEQIHKLPAAIVTAIQSLPWGLISPQSADTRFRWWS